MRDDFDVEDVLRNYRIEPSTRVKKTVLARFAGMRAPEKAGRRAPGFWKRPVPLYAAAAALVIVMGFSFAAGERSGRIERRALLMGDTLQTDNTRAPVDIKWVAAENDLL